MDDDYAASLCLTVGQVLRSVRARVAHEGRALHDDNSELRELLGRLRSEVDATTAERVEAALAEAASIPSGGGYVAVADLQQQAMVLREALVACVAAIPDRHAPARAAVRTYLTHQLERQRPWLVDAFTGPRR